ncbi:hypothetical protein IQ270_23460, partial [Microcoleus sp. LEGE 07076]|nr:hypothetical protein [Microcoleus sp. LEGE 07076]
MIGIFGLRFMMIKKNISDSRNGTRPKVDGKNLQQNGQSTERVKIVDKIPKAPVAEVDRKAPRLPESKPKNNILAKEPKTEK